jgi:rhodanese-related sulfurtransferase
MTAGAQTSYSRSPGCFSELSPREFAQRKDLVVLLVKAPEAAAEFAGFRKVIAIPCTHELGDALAGIGPEQPIGLVCPDGDCTGRLAIRLSEDGYSVVHLSGGLQEWHHTFRSALPQAG